MKHIRQFLRGCRRLWWFVLILLAITSTAFAPRLWQFYFFIGALVGIGVFVVGMTVYLAGED